MRSSGVDSAGCQAGGGLQRHQAAAAAVAGATPLVPSFQLAAPRVDGSAAPGSLFAAVVEAVLLQVSVQRVFICA